MDTFNIVVGIAGILAFALAIYQTIQARRAKDRELERLREQVARSSASLRSVLNAIQTVDLVVQQGKVPAATVGQLQAIARVARGILLSLAIELRSEQDLLKSWKASQKILNSDPPPDGPTGPGRDDSRERSDDVVEEDA